MDPKNSIWTEKYRPKKVSEMVGSFKDKILKYLEKPDAIPHFLLYSKTPGTGKCLIGEEIFLTNNGLISFNDYVKNKKIKNEKTDIVENIFCPENKFCKTEYFYKGKSKTIKIKTKNGYTIEGTPEHKIKIFDINNGFIWKRLLEIKEDDIIPIFYNTQIYGNNNKFNYSGFNELKKINDNSSISIIQPECMNKDIAFLLGVFVANGLFVDNAVRISTFKPWLQKKLQKIFKENFGINAKIRNYTGVDEGIDISRIWLSRFLKNICGCCENTARTKYVPKKILECSKEMQLNFIYGLLEDSWMDRNGYIEYTTASKQLAKEIKYMLLNLGFFVKHGEKYLEEYNHIYHNLTFSVEHSKKFLENFDMIYKNKKIEYNKKMNTNILSYSRMIEIYVKNQRRQNNIRKCDVYDKNLVRLNYLKGSFNRVGSIFYDLLKEEYLKDTIKMFISNDIFLDRVVGIKNNDEKDIYDFHIPKTHSFLANGIINHNTTLAKCIINELDCDALVLNSSDDRKIEVIRDKVKEFSITKSSKMGQRRCVFMDEFDGMLKASQEALRNIMETYASNVFFILTCNNINKVIEPLQSRCQKFAFAYPDKEEVAKYLEMICEKENMDYTEDGIKKLIDQNYPSIRNCVIALQDLNTEEKPVTVDTVNPVDELFEALWQKYKERDWKHLKEVILSTTVDPRDLNTFFWMRALNETEPNLKLIQVTCRNERDFANGADPKVIFVTSIIEMVK